MHSLIIKAAAAAALVLLPGALCVASTDEYRDADQLQSGYLPNHNMDPAVIDSASFGKLWQVTTGGTATAAEGGGAEQFMAKPLVYTPLKGSYGGGQVVVAVSETNWVYVLDAVNGTVYNSRQLHRPFLPSDLGCGDVTPQVGITGTPVIDPDTDIMYLYSKTYLGTQNGVYNGVYYFHAIDVNTLSDVYPPVNVNGGPADNDPYHGVYFTGGTHLQRTSLSLIQDTIWAGFGAHCDLFNYTGWVIGVDAGTGKVLTRFATEVGPSTPPQSGKNDYEGGGGGAGIWQCGMSLTSDSSSRLFFVTGNDNAHQNTELAASGRVPIGTLGQAIVNLNIDPETSKLSLADYFQPYDYIPLDGGDRDLGSSGIALLESSVFKGNSIQQIGCTAGKNGKAYIVDMNNLGGFKNGPGGGDSVLQTLPMPGGGPIFGGIGSCPLDGGYIYMTPIGYPTQVYKFIPDAQGNPGFTLVSQTPDVSAGRVGVGVPTITSNKGEPGTAILWVTDVDAGLRAYYAVPQPDGTMLKINMPPTPGLSKYQRPAFGDGRVYLSTFEGNIICLGSPVAQPFTCNVPIDFGSVTLGSAKTLVIDCIANIPLTRFLGLSLRNPLFEAQNSSLPNGPLAAGQSFSFPAVFNLTNTTINNNVNTSISAIKPGVQGGTITIYTVNGVSGYATSQFLALSGSIQSYAGFLSLSPGEVDFGGLVVNSAAAESGVSDSMVMSNLGVDSLTIIGSSWADITGKTSSTANITQITTDQYSLGPGFRATHWPQAGYILAGGSSVSIDLTFLGSAVGGYGSILRVWSTGGFQDIILSGTMSNPPVATLTVNNGKGGSWVSDVTGSSLDAVDNSTVISVAVDFGSLYPGNSTTYTLRLNNTGGSALLVTKSKPPTGDELTAKNPTGDLSEGLQIAPSSHADAQVIFQPSDDLSPINSDPRQVNGTWTLNTNDLTFDVHVVKFTGTVVVPQHGPLSADGRSIFKYLGCYLDAANGGPRLFSNLIVNDNNNENGLCQQQAYSAEAVFAATEFHTECWYGSTVPNITFNTQVSDDRCSWTCPADDSQPCGGIDGYMSIFYDSTKYDPETGDCSGCPSHKAVVGAYNYIGCYTEVNNGRALSGAAYAYDSMNLESCAANCTGYYYFGVEYGRECYCGNTLNAGAATSPGGDADCSVLCGGDLTEFCGAGGRLSMYALNTTASSSLSIAPTSTTSTTPTGPSIKMNVGSYSYYGCRTEATAARALSGDSLATDSMTLELCAATCAGWKYWGTEYGRECYCGDSLNTGSAVAPATDCNMLCPGNNSELCGAGNILSVYVLNPNSIVSASSANTPTPTGPASKATIGSYKYYGCRTEATTMRALSGAAFANDSMTLELCMTSCAGWTYWGTEYGRECYCGNSFNTGSIVAPAADCNMLCPGDSSELCGASNILSVYVLNPNSASGSLSSISSAKASTPTPTGPANKATVGSYKYYGCRTEATNARALSGAAFADNSMTLELCMTSCAGWTYWGTEYGRECYCGNSFNTGSIVAPAADCNMLCSGDSSELCGASNILSVYVLNPNSASGSLSISSAKASTPTPTGPANKATVGSYKYYGCRTEATNTRALSGAAFADKSMTLELCMTSCAGWTYWGTEYGRECYCGNSFNTGSIVAPATDCNMLCSGDSSELCGAGNIISVYVLNPNSVSGSLLSKSSAKATSASSTPIPTGPANKATIGSYKYYGCRTEATTVRALSGAAFANDGMTLELCMTSCAGWAYWGTEYGRECYCGNSFNPGSVVAPATDCNMLCPGDSSELCGAGNILSVYVLNPNSISGSLLSISSAKATSASSTPTPTGPANKATVGSYKYYGCRTEATTTRALSGAAFADDSMTLELCMMSCTGWTYWGTEYGRECYCGNSFNPGSAVAPATDCNMLCPGDSSELCGAGNILSVYVLNPNSVSGSLLSISSAKATSASSTPTPTGPANKATIGLYKYYGCRTEATTTRALSGAAFANDSMTLELCMASCTGWTYWGTEYGRECYCGDSFNAGSVSSPATDCSFSCPGDGTELCGAASRLSVYELNSSKSSSFSLGSLAASSSQSTTVKQSSASPSPTGPIHVSSVGNYKWKGCYTEGSNTRALDSAALANYTNMTVEMCADFCSPAYSMFGLEYGGECYCGSTLQAGSQLAPTTDCDMLCDGSVLEYCGASNRLDVYHLSNAVLSSSSIVSSKAAATTSISSSQSTKGSIIATHTGPPMISQGNVNFSYYDCLGEPSPNRALSNLVDDSNAMTVEKCLGECWSYKYAGIEWASECWCANNITQGTAFNQTGCSMACSGNSSEYCGGTLQLTVYQFNATKAALSGKS